MPAPEVVRQLVQRFDEHKHAYLSPTYNEAQLRQEFLNPFFEALGWDVANKQGYAVQYREVIHEDSIHIKGSANAKAPDYAFRLGGVRKFFVEAKKPAEDIENTKEYAYQLKIYAWSLGLPLSILTDFKGFAVYDCRSKPNRTDSPATGRIMYITYDQYVDRWDEIAGIFSPDAIRKGAFDQYAEDNTAKKGTIKVDDAFLQEIETWRTLLARNIALRNDQITNERQLNFAVQMTISRVIFLRISEDRGIEPQNQLLELGASKDIYPRLVALYMKADQKYNSGLFHFKAEAGSKNSVDAFTPTLVIDDKVLKTIIKSLYYPSPYVFKEIPVEILGQVYERFLGKVIRLTPARQAKIEEKPEVRKAGGVYYTPKYIVDYIVENTVGKLLEDKTPEEAARLKILDPACGSGSFLLGAFQYLMDWHEGWYLGHDPEGWTRGKQPALIHTAEGDWRLTTEEKKRILLNNIYGVDIDAQAVEVTKLSLLLKVLEEETGQLTLGFERALPDLGENIKCGNSLIGWDYFEGQLLPDEKEVERVNPFDWEKNFPMVFAKGGFDAVIGNPPYVRIQTMYKDDIAYFSNKYITTIGNYDIYCPFLEKAFNLLNINGLASYILPHRFFKTDYGIGLRKFLSMKRAVKKIVDFDGFMVFQNASINTCIMIISNEKQKEFKFGQAHFIKMPENSVANILMDIDQKESIDNDILTISNLSSSSISSAPWIFIHKWEQGLWKKLEAIETKLGDVTDQIFQGLKTGGDSIFSLVKIDEKPDFLEVFCKFDKKKYELEKDLLYSQVKGGEMKRFMLKNTNRVVLFPYIDGNLIDKESMKNNYPLTWDFLLTHKSYLENRESGKMKCESWYGYTRNQALTSMKQMKILTPDYYASASYCIDLTGKSFFFGGGAGGYGIVSKDVNMLYLLGLLNSKLLDWYLQKISVRQYQTAFSYVKKYIEQIPIKILDRENDVNLNQQNYFVSLVKSMLELKKRTPQTPQDKQRLQREIEATDARIDRLVYELYGLTDEEIRIVEGEG